MNNKNDIHAATTNPNTARPRFCDSFGFYGFLCLSFFAAFVAMIEFGGKF